MSPYLDDLPEELLQQVVSFLDSEPPSYSDVHEPLPARLCRADNPLKNLSCASRKWRRLVIPLLFTAIRLNIRAFMLQVIETGHDTNSKSFSCQDIMHGTVGTFLFRQRYHVRSICAFIEAGDEMVKKASWDSFNTHTYSFIWDIMLSYFHSAKVIVIAPPKEIKSFFNWDIDSTDEWYFDIPFQRIELQRNDIDGHRMDKECRSNDFLVSFNPCYLEYTEGSSMNVYGQYHYFEKCPPSILSNPTIWRVFPNSITNICYRAVFPHLHHFTKVVQAFGLPSLKDLTLQIAPPPSSSMLNDLTKVGRGNLRLTDCWSEIEDCYEHVILVLLNHVSSSRSDNGNLANPGTVSTKKSKITSFTSQDYRYENIRDATSRAFEILTTCMNNDLKNQHDHCYWRMENGVPENSATWRFVEELR